MPDCIFCKIVQKQIPAEIIFEDDNVVAFLDVHPVNAGHTLVIPKRHALDIFEIEESQWDAVMRAVRTVAHGLERSLQPVGINLAMNNRSGAGQTVFHAHVHVIPRYTDDGHESWKGAPYPRGKAQEVATKIRAAL